MAAKYYAVRKGKTTGIYRTWEACKELVDGYPGAQYKSFRTLEEAQAFLGTLPAGGMLEEMSNVPKGVDGAENGLPEIYAFVDGSFNSLTSVYGYGGFLIVNGDRYVLQGSGCDPEMAGMRNVAGEIMGSMAAMEKAIELGVKELAIYYDYMGIEMWATGAWKRNKQGTIAYYEYVQQIRDRLSLTFIKVKGHSGVEGNEEADLLAKQAVGIS